MVLAVSVLVELTVMHVDLIKKFLLTSNSGIELKKKKEHGFILNEINMSLEVQVFCFFEVVLVLFLKFNSIIACTKTMSFARCFLQ